MPGAENAATVEFLDNIADMLEIKGENTFRVRAYRDAARQIENLTEDIQDILRRGELRSIPGIGEGIAEKLTEFLTTGHSEYYENLKKQVNPGVAELLTVPGIGPKKARLFFDALGIDSVEKLQEAARAHRLSSLPRIGEKTEANILASIERMRGRGGRTPLAPAYRAAEKFLLQLREFPEVEKADLAGSLRRMRETIGDLDLIAASNQPEAVVDRFVHLPSAISILAQGPTKGSIITSGNLQVDLRVVKPEEYGAGLQYFTGSKPHNIRIRTIAEGKGLKVNEYGIFKADGERIAGETEESMYRALGLLWMPPELREDRGEIEAAREGALPRLVEPSHIKGDLHVHTDWSDGANSPEEMIEAARSRGYQYIAISDHSVSMGFIHGLTQERIQEQRALIQTLQKKYPQIKILHGIEVNIRGDGSLDYDDQTLAGFDVVTASVHSGLGMNKQKMTERIIRAIRNPYVNIFGHPTGRIIGKREPYEVDLEAVIRTATETGVALEINSQTDRLDLKDTDARLARDMGAGLCINSDAHAADQLDLMFFGVETARRGWVTPGDVLNALPLNLLLSRLAKPGQVRRVA
ncbi:MAG TPA: DNA polymerase/3'-5' exonuclease PolX [Armatimonadetes bacterium]|jgi:DNA polymerase (family 10)|nr:DNA polymerase/3'-5' exonuclease PolX [Armatimonadota bacterium]